MTQQEPRAGFQADVQPHAYDPIANPELFDGVLARRVLAFVIDVLIITIPVLLVSIFIFLFGIFTLGFGWLLFWLVSPATAVWAIIYYGVTMGSPASATYGMRAFDLEIRTWYGGPCYFLLGAVHGSCSGYRSRRSPRSWSSSGSSTHAGVFCTISCSAPWSSIPSDASRRCDATGAEPFRPPVHGPIDGCGRRPRSQKMGFDECH
jgi:RDD family